MLSVFILDDVRAQDGNTITMRRINPRQRRYRDVISTKVTEIIDARPMVETIVIPFLRTADESEKKN